MFYRHRANSGTNGSSACTGHSGTHGTSACTGLTVYPVKTPPGPVPGGGVSGFWARVIMTSSEEEGNIGSVSEGSEVCDLRSEDSGGDGE